MEDTDTKNLNPAGKAGGSFDAKVRPGGINQGQEVGDGPSADESTDALIQRKRMLRGDAVDNNAASHQGGMGAQGGQADFGSAGNLAGT